MKKVIAIFMVAAVTLMSGCTSYKFTSIEVVTMYSKDAHNKEVMLREIEKFNLTTGQQLGARIDYIVKSTDYDENAAIEAGNSSDIVRTTRIMPDYIHPINELPGGKEFIEDFYKKNYTDSAYEGEDVYRLPGDYTSMGLIYNKDLFRRAGIVDADGNPTPPRTYEEMRDYSRRISEIDYKVFGIAVPLAWSNWFNTDIVSANVAEVGYRLYDPENKRFNFSPYKPVLEMYVGIKEDKSYFPGAEQLGNDSARAQFSEGRIGMKIAGSWDVGVINDQFPAICDWGVSALPTLTASPKYPGFSEVGAGHSITRLSVKKHGGVIMSAAIRFLYSDDFMRALYIEGKSIPFNTSIVKDIPGSQLKPGMKEFIHFAETGNKYTEPPATGDKISQTGYDTYQEYFVSEVWSGNITVDDFIDTLNTVCNADATE